MNEKFEVGQWVRVTRAEQRFLIVNGLYNADIPALNQAEWTGVVGSYREYPSANDYRVDFSSGIRMWFNADMLELAAAPVQADPRDAQIKQLQGEVERLTNALQEIRMTRVMSSSMQAWDKCLEIADNALQDKDV